MKNSHSICAVAIAAVLSGVGAVTAFADGKTYVDILQSGGPSSDRTAWVTGANYWPDGAAINDPSTDYRIANGLTVYTAAANVDILAGNSYTFGIVGGTDGRFASRLANAWIMFPNEGVYLANGNFARSVSGSCAEIRGSVTVLSPKSAPFRIRNTVASSALVPSSYLFAGSISSSSECGLSLTWEKGSADAQSAAEAGVKWPVMFTNVNAFAAYHGLITVNSNVVLVLPQTTLPGSVDVKRHAALAVSNTVGMTTVGTLSLDEDTIPSLDTSVSSVAMANIRVTDTLTLPAGKVTLTCASLLSCGTNAYPAITLAAGATGSLSHDNFVLEVADAPSTPWDAPYLETSTNTAGDVILSVVYPHEVVKQIVSDPLNTAPKYDTSSAFTNEAAWSDGNLPTNPAVAYLTDGNYLRTPYDQTGTFSFSGGVLVVDRYLILRQATNLLGNVYFTGNGRLMHYQDQSPDVFGDITVYDRGAVTSYGGELIDGLYTGFRIHAALHGSGTFTVSGNKSSDSMPGETVLDGDASDFTGKFRVEAVSDASRGYPSLEKGYSILSVASGGLGAPLTSFTYDALRLDGMAVFKPLSTMTLAETTRGIFISVCGRIRTPEGVTLTVKPIITCDGLLRKEGAGELTIESATSVLSATSSVEVVEGTIRARNTAAFGDMPVVLDAGTALVFDLMPNESMATYGIRDMATAPFTSATPGGSVTIRFDASGISEQVLRSRVWTVPIFTVADVTVAQSLMSSLLVRPPAKSFKVELSSRIIDADTVTISATLSPVGFTVILR